MECLTDVGVLTDLILSGSTETATSSFAGAGRVDARSTTFVLDSGSLTESIEHHDSAVLADFGILSSTLYGASIGSDFSLSDLGAGAGRAISGSTEHLSTAGALTEIISSTVDDSLLDTGTVVSLAHPGGRVFGYALDVMTGTEHTVDRVRFDAVDQFAGTGAAIPFFDDLLDVADAGVLSDGIGSTGRGSVDVLSSGAFLEAIDSVGSVGVALLADSVNGFGVPSYAQSGLVWTAPVDAFAMSYLDMDEMTEIAVQGGVVYVSGPGGLYRIDESALKDDGETEVDALIQFARSLFGSSKLKRLTHIYVEHAGSGGLRVRVEQYPNAKREAYDYRLPARSGADEGTARFVLGKGLRSISYRVLLGNLHGGSFAPRAISVKYDDVSRRL